ncbi:MAG: response regulator [Elusimicrobia bacterium]|nr:response regulator [Elusimicrobiota bacterium]MDE2509604.1 response regulator [Elusimicrobiota bacterium]
MGTKLLIVDDDADIRRVLRGILTPLGTVLEAAGGAEALILVRDEKPSLMLLDVSMPVMDGLTVLTDALSIDPKLIVLMLTGELDLNTARRALDAGARAYVTKPFDPSTLCGDIRRLAGLDAVADDNPGRPWRVRR